ncbi:hypothetical protein [Pedococcus sp. 2YAF34]|uniref:hypothetical protein n=1 Tax=Pedococcus sp. 2YAF34 TaxID=3233032 RepID=UPI003F986315
MIYDVRHAMDMKNTVLGTLETDDDGIIIKWVPIDPEDEGRFEPEIVSKETLSYCQSHNRLYIFAPKGDRLAKALADARAQRHRKDRHPRVQRADG